MALNPQSAERPSKWSANDPWTDITPSVGAFPSSPQAGFELDLTGQRTLASAVKERRQDYIRKRHIKIKVGTWNVASLGDADKDLGGWFISGLGVRGLHQGLSGLSMDDEAYSSNDEHIESVEQQEARQRKKKSTLPKGEEAAIPSADDVGLYVLGLQEVIDISSVTEAMRPYYDPNPSKKWKHSVRRSLPRGYVKIAEQQLLGLLVLVFASPDAAPMITSVDTSSVGTGALGYMGNKGAVSTRIVLGGTTRILFVNCHLAAGADQAALTRRIWDTNQILARTKFQPSTLDGDINPVPHESIGDEDFAFWFGDLNYRLDDIPGEDVRRLLLLHTRNEYDVLNKSRRKIDSELGYVGPQMVDPSSDVSSNPSDDQPSNLAKHSSIEPQLDPKDDPSSLITTINSLLKHDQLRAQQRLRKAFHEGWREGEINFLPTYKYDVGSVGMFDSGEKRRSPSWCDRILYRTRRDRLDYEQRAKQETDARKRDDEMTAKGLDRDADEQEVLFDYDPQTDGVDNDDDYDEYDEVENAEDIQSVITEDGLQDIIRLEEYISHQRVLSSDHKPLSAVFDLIYDAVVPELKAQVQQEVARLLDKNENETRPSVTVVVEHLPENTAPTDGLAGAELNAVELQEVRYHVPKTRTVTIANTGPIPATFSFVDRGADANQQVHPCPSWMKIQVHHESHAPPKEQDDLGTSARFVLSPGDVATVDITVNILGDELVHALNHGTMRIDEVLVLRILNGRDHFISVRGVWMPSCFCRTLDELVHFPAGVRSVTNSTDQHAKDAAGSSLAHHSAPRELFDLTEALPGLVERAVADWAMIHQEVTPPWEVEPLWPFRGHVWEGSDEDRLTHLANIREALDSATPLNEHFDEQLPSLARAELLAETLLSFLRSLRDGVVTHAIWTVIEDNLLAIEKSRATTDTTNLQQMVMEALSTSAVHSVSFTFLTFMLTRTITELSVGAAEVEQTPTLQSPRRSRSSTEASEAPSELSTVSSDSTSTRSSFLPSLTLRRTGTPSTLTSPSTPRTPRTPRDRQKPLTEHYSDLFGTIMIRADRDHAVKGKEKKVLDLRKKKVIEIFLDSSIM